MNGPGLFAILLLKVNTEAGGGHGRQRQILAKMMEFEAGYFEHYRCRDKLRIILTPHEHDRMMDEPSLDIIVPAILETVAERSSVQNDC